MLVVRLALLAVVLFYVVRALAAGFGAVDWAGFRPSAWWLSAAGAALLASIAAVCLATVANIRALSPASPPGAASSSPSLSVLLSAVAVARLGRYVPGKVLSVVGVPLLLRPFGYNAVSVTTAVLLNSVLSVFTGLLVAAPLLGLAPHIRPYVPAGWLWMVLVMAAMVALLHPAVNRPVLGMLFRAIGKPPPSTSMRLRDYAVPSLWLLVQWAAMGVGLWCIGRSVDGAFSSSNGWVCASTAALAVTVGFLALFAPGGLGVREAIFLAVFTPLLDVERASLLAVGMRVMMLVTEVLAAAVGAVVLRYARKGCGP